MFLVLVKTTRVTANSGARLARLTHVAWKDETVLVAVHKKRYITSWSNQRVTMNVGCRAEIVRRLASHPRACVMTQIPLPAS
jgi:hypothetical protein